MPKIVGTCNALQFSMNLTKGVNVTVTQTSDPYYVSVQEGGFTPSIYTQEEAMELLESKGFTSQQAFDIVCRAQDIAPRSVSVVYSVEETVGGSNV